MQIRETLVTLVQTPCWTSVKLIPPLMSTMSIWSLMNLWILDAVKNESLIAYDSMIESVTESKDVVMNPDESIGELRSAPGPCHIFVSC